MEEISPRFTLLTKKKYIQFDSKNLLDKNRIQLELTTPISNLKSIRVYDFVFTRHRNHQFVVPLTIGGKKIQYRMDRDIYPNNSQQFYSLLKVGLNRDFPFYNFVFDDEKMNLTRIEKNIPIKNLYDCGGFYEIEPYSTLSFSSTSKIYIDDMEFSTFSSNFLFLHKEADNFISLESISVGITKYDGFFTDIHSFIGYRNDVVNGIYSHTRNNLFTNTVNSHKLKSILNPYNASSITIWNGKNIQGHGLLFVKNADDSNIFGRIIYPILNTGTTTLLDYSTITSGMGISNFGIDSFYRNYMLWVLDGLNTYKFIQKTFSFDLEQTIKITGDAIRVSNQHMFLRKENEWKMYDLDGITEYQSLSGNRDLISFSSFIFSSGTSSLYQYDYNEKTGEITFLSSFDGFDGITSLRMDIWNGFYHLHLHGKEKYCQYILDGTTLFPIKNVDISLDDVGVKKEENEIYMYSLHSKSPVSLKSASVGITMTGSIDYDMNSITNGKDVSLYLHKINDQTNFDAIGGLRSITGIVLMQYNQGNVQKNISYNPTTPVYHPVSFDQPIRRLDSIEFTFDPIITDIDYLMVFELEEYIFQPHLSSLNTRLNMTNTNSFFNYYYDRK